MKKSLYLTLALVFISSFTIAQEEKKDDKELEQYSESVQKRIAKLTKKWREAERQKDEAVTYAQNAVSYTHLTLPTILLV